MFSAAYCLAFERLSYPVVCVLVFGMVLLYAQPQKLTRYQRMRRNGGKHTELEWRMLKYYYGNRCAICGMRNAKLTKDHIVPVSKGGSDNISNIQPACQSCNSKKGAKIGTY